MLTTLACISPTPIMFYVTSFLHYIIFLTSIILFLLITVRIIYQFCTKKNYKDKINFHLIIFGVVFFFSPIVVLELFLKFNLFGLYWLTYLYWSLIFWLLYNLIKKNSGKVLPVFLKVLSIIFMLLFLSAIISFSYKIYSGSKSSKSIDTYPGLPEPLTAGNCSQQSLF